MKKAVIIAILFICFSNKADAQVCGGGILTFNIFTPNGSKVINYEYEVFPVSQEIFQKEILGEMKKMNSLDAYLHLYNNSGAEVSKQNADKIIVTDDPNLNNRLDKFLSNSHLERTGKVAGKLEFKTLELVDFPVILKITAEGKSVYILGNFFGNCNRYSLLVWSEKYTRVF